MNPNLARIFAKIDDQVHRMDLDRDGLGERLMNAAVDEMLADMDAERDPDGTGWPDLSDEYAAAKERHFPGRPMAVLHGVMKVRAEMEGERDIKPLSATMGYGVSPEAQQEGLWFQALGRTFWGFSAASIAKQRAILIAHAKRR